MPPDDIAVEGFDEAAVDASDLPIKLELWNRFGCAGFQALMRNCKVLRYKLPAVLKVDPRPWARRVVLMLSVYNLIPSSLRLDYHLVLYPNR